MLAIRNEKIIKIVKIKKIKHPKLDFIKGTRIV